MDMLILAKTATGICSSIPCSLTNLIANVVTIIKIGVPILLIIFGMIDLAKAIIQQDEKEIKKGQQTFIKRLIAAALVFLVVAIVQLVLNFIDADNQAVNCAKQIINGSAECDSSN